MMLFMNNTVKQHHIYVPYEPYNPSELSAMALQGYLRAQFGPHYVDVTTPDTASQRAKSVKLVAGRLVPGHWIATLRTATWIHLGGSSPDIFESAVPHPERVRQFSRIMRVTTRDTAEYGAVEALQEHLLMVGGAVVTDIPLTIIDLLRTGSTLHHLEPAIRLAHHVTTAQLDSVQEQYPQLPGIADAYRMIKTVMRYCTDAASVN